MAEQAQVGRHRTGGSRNAALQASHAVQWTRGAARGRVIAWSIRAAAAGEKPIGRATVAETTIATAIDV